MALAGNRCRYALDCPGMQQVIETPLIAVSATDAERAYCERYGSSCGAAGAAPFLKEKPNKSSSGTGFSSGIKPGCFVERDTWPQVLPMGKAAEIVAEQGVQETQLLSRTPEMLTGRGCGVTNAVKPARHQRKMLLKSFRTFVQRSALC